MSNGVPVTDDPLLLFQQTNIKIYLSGSDKVRLVGLDQLQKDKVTAIINHARQHKPVIIARLKRLPAVCEVCPAAGVWSFGAYMSKGLLCFYSVWFCGRSGTPAPCEVARRQCPLLTDKKKIEKH